MTNRFSDDEKTIRSQNQLSTPLPTFDYPSGSYLTAYRSAQISSDRFLLSGVPYERKFEAASNGTPFKNRGYNKPFSHPPKSPSKRITRRSISHCLTEPRTPVPRAVQFRLSGWQRLAARRPWRGQHSRLPRRIDASREILFWPHCAGSLGTLRP